MSAGPGSLLGLSERVHFGRRWKESGEHGILNHLMRGDRQRFCPACSGAASSQRPLTGSDTSLHCSHECVCVCECVLVRRQHCFSLPGVLFHTIFVLHLSILFAFPHQHPMLICCLHIFQSLGRRRNICVCGEGLSGRQTEAASCVKAQRWGQGHSLWVFGLGLHLACADWAGAWRENPEREINRRLPKKTWNSWLGHRLAFDITHLPIQWAKCTNKSINVQHQWCMKYL